MRCSKAKRYMELKLDGELKVSRQAVLSDHLNGCAKCRNWLAEAEKLQAVLSDAPKAEFPAWVHAQIMDKVHRLADQRPGFIRRYKLAPAGALLAVLLSFWAGTNVGLAGFSISNKSSSSTSTLVSTNTSTFGENSLLDIWDSNGDTNE